jgi:hypothetical protein
MFVDQIGVSAQVVAGAFDLDYNGVVKKPIQQSGCHNGVAEHLAPFSKAAIGRYGRSAFFMSLVDEPEEEVGAVGCNGQIDDLTDNE